MKRSIWIIIGVIVFGCGPQATKIDGNIEFLPTSGFAHLEVVREEGPVKLETLELDELGNFSTTIEISEPSFYRLNLNDRQYVTLILSGEEEHVTVNAHGNDPRGYSEVSGSYDTEYKSQMDALMKNFQDQRILIQQEQIAARSAKDVAAYNLANNKVRQLAVDTEAKLKELIWESKSLASLYGLQMIDQDKNYPFIDSLAIELVQKMPTHYMVQNLVSSLSVMKAIEIGAEAPEIALPDPDGNVVTLSSLRGNYVLIDFWAAWCRPCRAENPNVVKVYEKYSDKNFEIYGVSLDKTKAAWVGAIDQDGLPWIHVSDLQFWASAAAKLYRINTIPATYLIDPDGKIIAKDLRGASLEAKLAEIFG